MIDHSAINILALDDEPFMLDVLLHMLGRLGFHHVAVADNGTSALAMVGSPQPPNLILCDLNMPEMDGVEFIRRLGEHNYRGSLILVSGENARLLQSVEKLVHAHRIDLLGYLIKPVAPDSLARLIGHWRPPAAVFAPTPYANADAAELRAALAGGELVNHYQPKVEVATGRVVGVEALVRWQHPRHGMLFPDSFIGLAEEHGLIDTLTRSVFSAAMAQARQWTDAGLDLCVAINVSMNNLDSLDFLGFITAEAARFGIAPQNIILEVTESRLMQDVRAPLEILTRLRLRRFCLSIDDFGTGHSSLSRLRDIPFSELKIDRGFVHGASIDATARAVFEASLGVARCLGLEVVAEGVEDEADWHFLADAGCKLAQGYFIGRPMPGHALPSWMAQWQTRHARLAADSDALAMPL